MARLQASLLAQALARPSTRRDWIGRTHNAVLSNGHSIVACNSFPSVKTPGRVIQGLSAGRGVDSRHVLSYALPPVSTCFRMAPVYVS